MGEERGEGGKGTPHFCKQIDATATVTLWSCTFCSDRCNILSEYLIAFVKEVEVMRFVFLSLSRITQNVTNFCKGQPLGQETSICIFGSYLDPRAEFF